GDTIEPQKIAEQNGIEIRRLLIASAEYGDNLRLGKIMIDQSGEMYRKLRNTLRYCLGALRGFEDSERVPLNHDLPLMERWLLHRLHKVDAAVRKGYDTYQWRVALGAIVEFCNVDLSASYVDVR